MNDVFAAVPVHMDAITATHHAAGATHCTAGAADSQGMLGAAAVALGPIGATYLAAYAPAQANNLAATMLVGLVHHALGAGTDASKATILASDHACA